MAEHPNPKEPAKVPAPMPRLSDIIAEGNREIGAQARAAAESILTKGDFASSAQLRKWGPQGANYFLKVLQQRIAKKSQPAPTGASTAETAVTGRRPAAHASMRGKTKAAKRKSAPVSMDLNWTAQQHSRWSARTRAVTFGILVAATLLVGAAAFIRFWPTLGIVLQQLIQNRS